MEASLACPRGLLPLVASSMILSLFSASSSANYPVELQGRAPEQDSVVITTSKPADASSAKITLHTYDADFPTEGELIINGNRPIPLFGNAGVKGNDQNSTDITLNTPLSYWKNGSNTLLFKHLNTAGFIVDGAKVSFTTTPTSSSFPVDMRGKVPEQQSVTIHINKPSNATSGALLLETYDADFPTEGELIINENDPVSLFGKAGVKGNDQNAATVTLNTPASYWKDGSNTLRFRHISTAGFVIDSVTVSFDSSTQSNYSPEAPPLSSPTSSVEALATSLTATGLQKSGPIVISARNNVTISGLNVTNPNGPCVKIRNASSNIIIKDSIIGPCGKNGIQIEDSNKVTVTRNYIRNTKGAGVLSRRSHIVTVDSNMIEDARSGYEMWDTTIGNLRFSNNFVKNVHRDNSLKSGGNVALVANINAKGVLIINNTAVNVPGRSETEDLVNVWKSNGKPGDPIRIENNVFYGGGPSMSGGGILLADKGGSYQEARNNILVNPGQYGIAMSGHHNVLSNNKVYSDNTIPYANLGVSIGWTVSRSGGDCYALDFSNNEITFFKGTKWISTPGKSPYLYPSWKWSGCTISGWNTNKFDTPKDQPASLDKTILPASIRNYY